MTMRTVTVPQPSVSSPSGGRLYWAVADALTMTKRNLIGYTRVPEAIFFSSVQPIMFVLLFRYVFGARYRHPGTTTCSSSCQASSSRRSPSDQLAPPLALLKICTRAS